MSLKKLRFCWTKCARLLTILYFIQLSLLLISRILILMIGLNKGLMVDIKYKVYKTFFYV